MDVVVRAADGKNENPVFLADAGDAAPHRRLELGLDNFAAILRAENDVNYILCVRVGICAAPTALEGLLYHGPSASALG